MTHRITEIELSSIKKMQAIHLAHTAQILSAIKRENKIFLCVLEDDEEKLMVPVTVKVIRSSKDFNDFAGFTFVNTLRFDERRDSYHVFYIWGEIKQ